jgi:hypothetical protein
MGGFERYEKALVGKEVLAIRRDLYCEIPWPKLLKDLIINHKLRAKVISGCHKIFPHSNFKVFKSILSNFTNS